MQKLQLSVHIYKIYSFTLPTFPMHCRLFYILNSQIYIFYYFITTNVLSIPSIITIKI